MEKLIIELEPGAWHGHASESVWATSFGVGLFKVENSQFFARGISYGDIVHAESKEGANVFERTVTSSGGSTYRIFLGENVTDAQFERFWRPLEAEGCTYESGEFGYAMYSVDVPKDTDVQRVFSLLNEGLLQKVWDFEEGHYGHAKKLP
ncbi:uncharacterized protein DUF4265 [Shimia isoporae]|uniref:Uncharacterized protein DUF4265 n=1 Tax=Shimia isoporae TaxID=647720 RepID=A0A4R1N3L3_9RHOB|nr:DUF4265 domain-containing protein [Shimia isoporae]TCL00303.1 uncharacterized protein DUF4265 [Shimia isoporae]